MNTEYIFSQKNIQFKSIWKHSEHGSAILIGYLWGKTITGFNQIFDIPFLLTNI